MGVIMPRGLIIIPAYNEEKNIGKVLEKINNLILDMDVLVVNDGSRDNTRRVVLESGGYVISHPFNQGYGAALQTGFKYAKEKNYDYVIQFDADGQHSPEELYYMKEEICEGIADIINGSRFLGRTAQNLGALKKMVINMLRFIIRITTGTKISDPTCGFKALSKRTFEYYSAMGNFPPDYPDADVLIQMLKLGYKVKEIPINVQEREAGKSMHSGIKPAIYLAKMLLSIIVILLRNIFDKGVYV